MINKKIFAIIFFVMIVTISFTVFNSENVKAADVIGCCEKTSNAFCVNDVTQAVCVRGFHSYQQCSQVPGNMCKQGVCIPAYNSSSDCQVGKTKSECEAFGGRWADASSLEEVLECAPGCCDVKGGFGDYLVSKAVCINRAIQKWHIRADQFDAYAKFDTNIKTETECQASLFNSKKGCCVLNGDCKEEFFTDCVAAGGGPENFYDSTCGVIEGCGLTPHSSIGCGTLVGTTNDIYNFDNGGNQEDLNRSCGYPAFSCLQCSNNTCTDQKDNSNVKFGEPYCKKLSCDITLTGSQMIKLRNHQRIVSLAPETSGLITLRHGEQMCYNFYGSFEKSTDAINQNTFFRMYSKSTGLQNQYIECLNGEIFVHGVDPTRNTLCEPNNSIPNFRYTNTSIINNWQNCSSCGKRWGGVPEYIGDFFNPFFPTGYALSYTLANHCTEAMCEKLGDCWFDTDFADTGFGKVGSCVPLYPPAGQNLQAGTCGDGGDALWNVCDAQECYSLGDYQWSHSGWAVPTGVLVTIVGTFVERFNLIPVECITYATIMSTQTVNPIGFFPAFWECTARRGSQYGKYVVLGPVALFKNKVARTILQYTVGGPGYLVGWLTSSIFGLNSKPSPVPNTENGGTFERGESCSTDNDCMTGLSCRTRYSDNKLICVELSSKLSGESCIRIKEAGSECKGYTDGVTKGTSVCLASTDTCGVIN